MGAAIRLLVAAYGCWWYSMHANRLPLACRALSPRAPLRLMPCALCSAAAVHSLLLLSTPCSPPAPPQIFLVFYQYYIDWGMMGRRQGWQYPQMLAKHLAPRIGWSMAGMVTVGQVGGPCRGGRAQAMGSGGN